MQKQLFITMDGGLIQNISISKDLEEIEVIVMDFDIEGLDKKDLTLLPSGDSARIWKYDLTSIDNGDVEFFEEILKLRMDKIENIK